MKGVITDYFEDRRFGFIRDENDEKRFFHLNNIYGSKKFLDNIFDYYFSDYEERLCCIVNFTPSQGEKGLTAQRINLTGEILNHKTIGLVIEAVITDLNYDKSSLTRLVQGVKKGGSAPPFSTAGGNGTYRIGYPEEIKALHLDFQRIDNIGWGKIDIRDLALSINNRTNVTSSFVQSLKQKLVGITLKITAIASGWKLVDGSILKL